MCGIAGILNTSKPETELKYCLRNMLNATKHRGPDHTGYYIENGVALGMNRLSILDLSEAANQPLYSIDGRYVIVYNGEVYNHHSIRKELELKGYRFQSRSDTEVVLAGYIFYGKNVLEKIRGMFAFAIWDKTEQALFCARDHLGIKPFLYSFSQNQFSFCSELKGLLTCDLVNPSKLSKTALATYLSMGNTIPPFTMIEGINALKSGHYLVYKNNEIKEISYWSAENFKPLHVGERSYIDTVKEVRELIIKSVEEELMSDVPIGVFLSGGLDSAIVTACMKICGCSNIKTFTVGFEGAPTGVDERTDAEIIADYFGTDHQSIQISNDYVRKNFHDYIKGLDQPSCDGLNTYLVSKHAAQEVKVALSGLGGDEFFIGYHGFKKFLTRKKHFIYSKINKWSAHQVVAPLLPEKLYAKLYESLAAEQDILYYVYLLQRNPEYLNDGILENKWSVKNVNHITADLISDHYSLSDNQLTRIRQLYSTQFMGNLLLRDSDAVAMKSSLEVRFPLIDKRLVELAHTIPLDYLINNNSKNSGRNYIKDGWKKVLVDAFRTDLPDELFTRNKRGFQLPINVWLNSSLKDIMLDSMELPSEIFNSQKVKLIYNQWKSNNKYWKGVWSVLMLDQWHKNVNLKK